MLFRRSTTHMLLSLLLLLSQLIAVTHVYAHWPALRDSALQTQQTHDGGDSQQLGTLDDCAQCHAGAQLQFAAFNPPLFFLPHAGKPLGLAAPLTFIACLVTVCVFQSRAPPQA